MNIGEIKGSVRALVALVVMFFVAPVHWVASTVTRWSMEVLLRLALWSRKEG